MPNCTIQVTDERPEIVDARGGQIKIVAQFPNVPENWETKDILQRFGIAEHLTVWRSYDGGARRMIQEGRRYK